MPMLSQDQPISVFPQRSDSSKEEFHSLVYEHVTSITSSVNFPTVIGSTPFCEATRVWREMRTSAQESRPQGNMAVRKLMFG